MAHIYSKLRSDLEFRQESSDPDSHVLVKDPITRKFYRFDWVQGAVLHSLNGEHGPAAIAEVVSQKCQTTVETGQIEGLVEKLEDLLLLDDPVTWAKLEKLDRSRGRLLDGILSIKLRAFNPDALITRLEKKVRFCFTGAFAGIVCVSLFVAVYISILHWDALYVSVGSLFSLYSIPLIIAVVFTVTTIHEFAHGVTLKHFGGKAQEMGFLVLYFMPGFYCNVDDAWLLAKRERILVTAAGGFIQLFIWSLATIAWRMLSPETIASRVCVVTIAFSGIQTLFNFNPLIRLDGYYLLSDYLEVPNLRSKAFRFLKEKLQRWLLGTPGPAASLEPGARERRIFRNYGIAAFVFSAGLLGLLFIRATVWLVDNFQFWGMLLATGVALMSVETASQQGLGGTGRFIGAVAERMRKSSRFWFVLAAMVVGGLLPWELKVSGDFTIRSVERVLVSSQIEGTLRTILVDQGKTVRSGDLLAELENLELDNEYQETKGELTTREASLRLLLAGTRPEEIDKARKHVDTRQTELANVTRTQNEKASLQETVAKKEAERQNAGDIHERSKRLYDEKLISRNDLDRDKTSSEVKARELSEARSQLDVLEEKTERGRQLKNKELGESQSELKLLLAGSRKETIAVAQAEVNKLKEKLRILDQGLEQLKIRSPIEGVVATPYLKNRTGEYLKKGDLLCEVVSLGMMVVDMPVPEKEIADVKIGNPIILKVRGYPNQSFQGQVASISPVAVEDGLVRKLLVMSELENKDGMLKTGMTGVGKIYCGKRIIANLLTRRAVRWLRTEFWEYLP